MLRKRQPFFSSALVQPLAASGNPQLHGLHSITDYSPSKHIDICSLGERCESALEQEGECWSLPFVGVMAWLYTSSDTRTCTMFVIVCGRREVLVSLVFSSNTVATSGWWLQLLVQSRDMAEVVSSRRMVRSKIIVESTDYCKCDCSETRHKVQG